ncbi:DNA topoisomerase I, variant [Capsaspora owczarzaki ATCC 30864]|nr:DNA topoisomerase I, variant [Capsaspora owczarzaki ATCC 30864]
MTDVEPKLSVKRENEDTLEAADSKRARLDANGDEPSATPVGVRKHSRDQTADENGADTKRVRQTPVKTEVKSEPAAASPRKAATPKGKYAEADSDSESESNSDSDADDKKSLAARLASKAKASPKPSPKAKAAAPSSAKKAPTPKKAAKKESSDEESEESEDSSEDEDDGSDESGSDSGSDDDSDDEDAYDDEDAPKPKKPAVKKAASPKKAAASPKTKPAAGTSKKASKSADGDGAVTKKKKKADEDDEDVHKWWEEDLTAMLGDGSERWQTLSHNGVMLAPEYVALPPQAFFKYNGQKVALSLPTEELIGFYAAMLKSDYVTKDKFNENFMVELRKVMTKEEKALITDLAKCDFTVIQDYFEQQREIRKNRTKEEKAAIKAQNEELVKQYGFCLMDGRKERIANFRVEPPGLFRGRGDHPKMGMLKRRVVPEDITINCSKDSTPPAPPAGHKWKEVICNKTVTWLASWVDGISGHAKYVMLNSASKLKGLNDMKKYEKARDLKKHIKHIRRSYTEDMSSKEMAIRQRATALHFIDRLALRCGNEKDPEEQADTVGCCSLRFEHIKLEEPSTVHFDFLGKDSIRYQNSVDVEERVYKNLIIFQKNKEEGDLLFDRLTTTALNKYLTDFMPGLTAKVFRTYNASITLQEQLKLTPTDGSIHEKVLAYNRANRAVAVLCNHQRSVPKKFGEQMDKMDEKIEAVKKELNEARKVYKETKDEKKKAAVERLKARVDSLVIQKTDKDENKTIALSTAKLNYLDPRITVAWCKRYDVPVEKIYNKTQRSKFAWSMGVPTDFTF